MFKSVLVLLFVSSVLCKNLYVKDVLAPSKMHKSNISKHTRIVGGSSVPSPNPYPWMVFFLFSCGDESASCGGTLIQDNVVMTAAHCWFFDCNMQLTGQLAIGRNLNSAEAIINGDFARYAHPDYNDDTNEDDIALIVMEGATFDMVEKMPRIATGGISSGTKMQAAGWGAQEEDGASTNTLREVTLETKSDNSCDSIYDVYVKETQLCGGSINGAEKDTCQGDSGGPFFEIEDCCDFPSVTVHGITSYGFGCARVDAVYTQVEEYIDWIDSVLDDEDIEKRYNQETCCECDGTNDIGETVVCVDEDDDDDFDSGVRLFFPLVALVASFLSALLL